MYIYRHIYMHKFKNQHESVNSYYVWSPHLLGVIDHNIKDMKYELGRDTI